MAREGMLGHGPVHKPSIQLRHVSVAVQIREILQLWGRELTFFEKISRVGQALVTSCDALLEPKQRA